MHPPLPPTLRDAARRLATRLDALRDARCADARATARRGAERAAAAAVEAVGAAERALAAASAVRAAQRAFRAELAPALAAGWIVNRSITKPRGYAGDHALIDAFYTRTTSEGAVGRFLDELVLDCAAGRAVVERKRFVARWVRERLDRNPCARVVDVACGPCRLEKDLLDAGAGTRARFVAIDGDPEALAYADRVLGRGARVELRHENAVQMARDPRAASVLDGSDLIVSLGLFDYLPDRIASRLLRAFARALRPGGEMLVGNFADGNPSRTFMEWFGDWPLIHRSEREFLGLFEDAGLDARDLRLEREAPGGAILLVTARAANGRRELTADPREAAAA